MKVGGRTPKILDPISPRSDARLGAQTICENSRFCKLLPGCRARQSLSPARRTPRAFAWMQPFCTGKPGRGE